MYTNSSKKEVGLYFGADKMKIDREKKSKSRRKQIYMVINAKNLLIAAEACALTVALTAGCGVTQKKENYKKKNEEEKITLTIALPVPALEEHVTEINSLYMASHPEIGSIKWVCTDANTYRNYLRVAMAENNLPDIFSAGYGDCLEEWKSQLSVINDSNDQTTSLIWRNAGKIGDDRYAIPFLIYGQGVLYNRELLQENGFDSFPDTYDKWDSMCKQLKTNGVKPVINHYKDILLTGNADFCMLPLFIGTERSDAIEVREAIWEERKLRWPEQDFEADVEALANYIDGSIKNGNKDSLATGLSTAENYFHIGQYSMLNFMGSWDAAVLKSGYPEMSKKISIAPVPFFNDSSENHLAIDAVPLSVTKEGGNAAESLALWLSTSEEAEKYLEDAGFLLAKSMDDSADTRLSQLALEVKNEIKSGNTYWDPDNWLQSEIKENGSEIWSEYLAGTISRAQVISRFMDLYNLE